MKKGFTLIEILIVIAIIGILSSTVIVAGSSSRQKAKNTQIKSDMANIAKAAELYYYKHQDYADDKCAIDYPGCPETPDFVPEFLDVWPIHPVILMSLMIGTIGKLVPEDGNQLSE